MLQSFPSLMFTNALASLLGVFALDLIKFNMLFYCIWSWLAAFVSQEIKSLNVSAINFTKTNKKFINMFNFIFDFKILNKWKWKCNAYFHTSIVCFWTVIDTFNRKFVKQNLKWKTTNRNKISRNVNLRLLRFEWKPCVLTC